MCIFERVTVCVPLRDAILLLRAGGEDAAECPQVWLSLAWDVCVLITS